MFSFLVWFFASFLFWFFVLRFYFCVLFFVLALFCVLVFGRMVHRRQHPNSNTQREEYDTIKKKHMKQKEEEGEWIRCHFSLC